MYDLIVRLLGRRVRVVVQGSCAILFMIGLTRTLFEREWGYAAFCAVFALLFVLGTVRAIRSEPVSLTEDAGPGPPSPKAAPPIEPR